ncbi:glutamyl-tRNA amidotransferase subunit A [Xylogone sp. PMI_703]|nr:glutamyl-tRNA amidotransferase subunit A [Xylogone sp. PMI_703]
MGTRSRGTRPATNSKNEKDLLKDTKPTPDAKAQRSSLGFSFKTIVSSILILIFASVIWYSRVINISQQSYPDLLEANVEELVAGLRSGAWTSVDLTTAYINRIKESNPVLHAVTEINPDALSIATTLDAERANGIVRSPLHGIPILLKDNIATMDLMNNTAGSYSLIGAMVSSDATVASKLRAAGVILLGKSNMSQWANFRSTNSSNGWSAYGGQVTGAYYPNMDPSGSSSGSGVSSSIGLALAALGTETSGSILSPASVNNLVGIKPSVGLTSRYLVIPISEHQDTVGPMARTVTDAAHILSIIAGKDPKDNYTLAQPFASPPNYAAALNYSALNGARIGIPRNAIVPGNHSESIFKAFDESIKVLQGAGAEVVESNFTAWDEYLADRNAPMGNCSIVLCADFVADLSKYFAELTSNPNHIRSLADMLEFTKAFDLESYPKRDTALWDTCLSLHYDNTDSRFWEAYQFASYFGGKGGVTGALETFNLDAIIMPTDYSWPVPALAGLPAITIPMGFYPADTPVVAPDPWKLVEVGPNIPFGLSFIGDMWTEGTLISFAYAFEQRTFTRTKVAPYFVPRSQLKDVIHP